MQSPIRTCIALIAIHMVAAIETSLADDEPTTVLGVEGSHFTLNGRPTFLLGISYYGALGAPQAMILKDLDDLERHGFNWLRVWATWGAFDQDISAVDAAGAPHDPFLFKLRWLVAACDRRGIVVDVTLHRAQRLKTLPGGGLPEYDAHQRAVETIVNGLQPYRNWYLDLANERNIADERFVGIDELAELRATARRLDERLLVTASSGGDISQEELRDLLRVVEVDFLCPHRPRDAASPAATTTATSCFTSASVERHCGHPARDPGILRHPALTVQCYARRKGEEFQCHGHSG